MCPRRLASGVPGPRALFALWIASTVLGAIVLALPDDEARVFSFSAGHGPAPLDLVGIAIVAVGLAAYVAGLVVARRRLRGRDAAVAIAAYVPASALAAWSVATDAGAWWLAGVGVALAAMAWLAWRVSRSRVPRRG